MSPMDRHQDHAKKWGNTGMQAETCSVPVEHTSISHEVRPIQNEQKKASLGGDAAEGHTLIDLIEAVGDVTEDENEIVATVIHMLESGRVRLSGEWEDCAEGHRASA